MNEDDTKSYAIVKSLHDAEEKHSDENKIKIKITIDTESGDENRACDSRSSSLQLSKSSISQSNDPSVLKGRVGISPAANYSFQPSMKTISDMSF